MLSSAELLEVMKEARDFYNLPETKEKISRKLGKFLLYSPQLKFFSLFFQKIDSQYVNSEFGEITGRAKTINGKIAARCFVGVKNLVAEGYNYVSIMPNTKKGFINSIKKCMSYYSENEFDVGAIWKANEELIAAQSRAGGREKGILEYDFFFPMAPKKYITAVKREELPKMSELEEIATEISKKLEKTGIEKGSGNVTIATTKSEKILVNSEGSEIIYDPDVLLEILLNGRIRKEYGIVPIKAGRKSVEWQEILKEKDVLLEEFVNDVEEQIKAKDIAPGQYDLLLINAGLGTALHEAQTAHLCTLPYIIEEMSGAFSFDDIGKKILHEKLTIISDPLAFGEDSYNFYRFDDEGIEAKKIVLVKKGKLVNLLSDRLSTSKLRVMRKKFKEQKIFSYLTKPNGHARIENITEKIEPRISNLIVEIEGKRKSFSQLETEFIKLLKKRNKKFGIVCDFFSGWVRPEEEEEGILITPVLLTPHKFYKIDLNGKTEPVARNLSVVAYPRDLLAKIYDVGGKNFIENAYCGSESGIIKTIISSPAAILLDMTLEKMKNIDVVSSFV